MIYLLIAVWLPCLTGPTRHTLQAMLASLSSEDDVSAAADRSRLSTDVDRGSGRVMLK